MGFPLNMQLLGQELPSLPACHLHGKCKTPGGQQYECIMHLTLERAGALEVAFSGAPCRALQWRGSGSASVCWCGTFLRHAASALHSPTCDKTFGTHHLSSLIKKLVDVAARCSGAAHAAHQPAGGAHAGAPQGLRQPAGPGGRDRAAPGAAAVPAAQGLCGLRAAHQPPRAARHLRQTGKALSVSSQTFHSEGGGNACGRKMKTLAAYTAHQRPESA